METCSIGIDIGGTTIKGVILNQTGEYRNLTAIPTEAEKGGAVVLKNLLSLINMLLQHDSSAKSIIGVGIGTPGGVDASGVVSAEAVNLPGWKGTQLFAPITERFGLQATAGNDGTLMTLAEAKFGAGKGFSNMICYALGTGIGGGIVINHKIYYGRAGLAGEVGHVMVESNGTPCGCGQRGCVERYASGRAIVEMALEASRSHNNQTATPFVKVAQSMQNGLTAKIVYEYVAAGDPVACAVHERVCEMLARAIGISINTLSPDLVVLGGGVMKAGHKIIDSVTKHLPHYCLEANLKECVIVPAALGENAGVIGAAALVFENAS